MTTLRLVPLLEAPGDASTAPEASQPLSLATPRWRGLPLVARMYVAGVITGGAVTLTLLFPTTAPDPVLFALLATFACVTSAWKVTLPLPIANGSTLSVSYTANLMALLLLGPRLAMLIAIAGVWTQCVYKPKQPYPAHRTLFSVSTAVLTMAATSVTFSWFEGPYIHLDSFQLARALVPAIATYFVVNTGLIACAIALSSGRPCFGTWREEFLWSGASFMVAGTAGAIAVAIIQRGDQWKAAILIAPIYLTYRTYELFASRLNDQKRHTEEVQRLHHHTMDALDQAREAERALADEKERLGVALAEMRNLEHARNHLLEREQVARASAENANRLKDQFLAIVSHELRTPLNAILGWSDILCKDRLDERLRERAVHGIGHSARRQAQLIDDLLDVARITSGKLRLENTFVDLRDTIRDAVEVVQPSAGAKHIALTVPPASPPGEVYGDGARLQQIVVNLLSNAVKFTAAGGDVRVSLRRVGECVELEVADTGKGIAPHFLPWVFEPFRQADGSTTRVHAGLGLGLAIVKTLAQAHRGTVSAHSRGEGLGATFTVRLPVTTAVDRLTVPRRAFPFAPAAATGQPVLHGVSVLVVDDDEESRDAAVAHLQHSRALVLTASSAAQALELLQRERVDVLLADIGMPGEDGYDLIRKVRAMSASRIASIPAAALTAFASDDDRKQALSAGYQLHLAKPIDTGALLSAVADLRRMCPMGA
jgi:signal transduction histidine kinase